MSRFRSRYGASSVHLIAHLIGFAIAAYALVQLLGEKRWVNFLGWFVGAALFHDVVLLPVYSAIDRVVVARARAPARSRSVPIINHLRVPALISAVLLLIYFPLILGRARGGYLAATGHDPAGYLRNWLLITATLFAGSGAVYAVRVWRR
jgi:hypothetical protein